VQPAHEYPVRSNTAGILAKPDGVSRYVDKGDHVKAGDPLAVVQDSETRYMVDKARAELEERQKRADEATSPVLKEFDNKIASTTELLGIARREQDRIGRLVETHAGSSSDFDKAMRLARELAGDLDSLNAEKESMRLQLKRELQVAEAVLKSAQWDLDQQTLRSPIDGVVLDRPVSLGTRMALNDHLLTVADVRPENLVMRAQVDEEDITRVRVDEKRPQVVKMTLYAFSGRSFDGTVTKIYDKADPDRRTFEVDVTLTAPDPKLAAGMTGELAFIVAERASAKVVPSQAVQDGAVWAVRNGRLRRLDAVVGIKSIERAEIMSGLNAGDSVVISPVGKLTDGSPVRTVRMDPAEAAGVNKPKAAESPVKFN
jgi:RND family efflux transporter MFP subunit